MTITITMHTDELKNIAECVAKLKGSTRSTIRHEDELILISPVNMGNDLSTTLRIINEHLLDF